MRGLRTSISNFVLFAAAALAQTPDYFPLAVGNVWIYRQGGAPGRDAAPVTVEVTRAAEFGGRTYFEVREYRRGSYWLRNDWEGRVWQYDEKAGAESLWYDFTRRAGEVYQTALPTCCGRAEVVSTAASKQVALGQFDRALYQLTYPGVFQVGITEEDFFPYVGLLYRSENTGGPGFRTLDLTYAKISGVTVLNASGLGFGVARRDGWARIFLNNNTGGPLRLVFLSGQTYDLTVSDREGKALWRWSDGRGFTMALRAVDMPAGETSWPVEFPSLEGAATLTAELVTAGGRFTATVPLESGPSSRP